jgi:hypothetical protein
MMSALSLEDQKTIDFLDRKLDEAIKAEVEENSIDFDRAYEEYQNKNKPIKIKFKGRTFNIPASVPTQFYVFYLRNCIRNENGKQIVDIPTDKMPEFIKLMFGEEFYEFIIQNEIEFEFVIGKMASGILEKWKLLSEKKTKKAL